MIGDLLLLRFAWPSAFRGVRLLAGLLLLGTVLVLGLGFLVEIGSDEEDHLRHGHDADLEREIR